MHSRPRARAEVTSSYVTSVGVGVGIGQHALRAHARGMASAEVFGTIGEVLRADPTLAKKVGGVLRFSLTQASGGTATWTVDCKAGAVSEGEGGGKADVTISLSESDFIALASGKASGMKLFMGGKMKMKGNMGLAQKFQQLADAARKAGKVGKGGAAAPATSPAATPASAAAVAASASACAFV